MVHIVKRKVQTIKRLMCNDYCSKETKLLTMGGFRYPLNLVGCPIIDLAHSASAPAPRDAVLRFWFAGCTPDAHTGGGVTVQLWHTAQKAVLSFYTEAVCLSVHTGAFYVLLVFEIGHILME
ncbi:hypothetical protein AGOR_G00091280 [Albula goreensis]|uniref:Uncharacterized protein n=1 Tax=Albula goreensis TaxID=1534307 RepID=A0A8T3DPD7_9TELE|nr:hypothetical protein AGOR_G00091280 [Albula goreensis]